MSARNSEPAGVRASRGRALRVPEPAHRDVEGRPLARQIRSGAPEKPLADRASGGSAVRAPIWGRSRRQLSAEAVSRLAIRPPAPHPREQVQRPCRGSSIARSGASSRSETVGTARVATHHGRRSSREALRMEAVPRREHWRITLPRGPPQAQQDGHSHRARAETCHRPGIAPAATPARLSRVRAAHHVPEPDPSRSGRAWCPTRRTGRPVRKACAGRSRASLPAFRLGVRPTAPCADAPSIPREHSAATTWAGHLLGRLPGSFGSPPPALRSSGAGPSNPGRPPFRPLGGRFRAIRRPEGADADGSPSILKPLRNIEGCPSTACGAGGSDGSDGSSVDG